MTLTLKDVIVILDRITKTNKAWYTRDFNVARNTYMVGMLDE